MEASTGIVVDAAAATAFGAATISGFTVSDASGATSLGLLRLPQGCDGDRCIDPPRWTGPCRFERRSSQPLRRSSEPIACRLPSRAASPKWSDCAQ